jgi:hypothetical protein
MTWRDQVALAHNLINRICAEVGTTFAGYIRDQLPNIATFLGCVFLSHQINGLSGDGGHCAHNCPQIL